jgi:peptidoglycan/LPS O-acetylase OafA/YrhL
LENKVHHEFAFLDGLRGIAALQVVCLHYFSAFLPVLADATGKQHFAWEEGLSKSILSYAWDGYSAVYLFFVMSGFVLAQSFINTDLPLPLATIKRFIRLFIPVFTAGLIALALAFATVHTRGMANSVAMSDWLAGPYHNPMTAHSVAKDLLLSSMLFGYQNVSLFQPVQDYLGIGVLSPAAFALNAPMWTLHGEFWGSMLTLLLSVFYKRLPMALFGMLVIAVLLLTGTSQLSLFVIGFLLYFVRGRLLSLRGAGWVGISAMMIFAGVWICVRRNIPDVLWIDVHLIRFTWLRAYNDAHFESSLGAFLVLLGMLVNRPLRIVLSTTIFQRLGRLSFSVYLLHFPILFSVGCFVFYIVQPHGYLFAVFTSLIVGVALTLACASVFERDVDRRAIRLSKVVSRLTMNRGNPSAPRQHT